MPTDNTLEDTDMAVPRRKNFAIAAWHAPLGGCLEEADLCRGQGFRRIAPSAPPRPEDRHVQGPAGSQEERVLIRHQAGPLSPPELADARGTTAACGEAVDRFAPAIFRFLFEGLADVDGRIPAASDP